ncbi:CHASE2 domain-containing protein [Pseudomonas sp. TH31]|nr:CHASE2 domain-containing protein [Pseudomonas sp. TH31]
MILLPCVGLLASHPQWPLDRFIYDKLMPLITPPIDSRILLVAIDDASISAIGRWPWPRDVHARLLDKLAPFKPKVVLYDIIFTEPDPDPKVDERLGKAMARIGTVVVPTLRTPNPRAGEPPHFAHPINPVAEGAWAIGHIDVAADIDGVIRRVYIKEGNSAGHLTQLAWLAYSATFPADRQPVMPDICCVKNLGGQWLGWNEEFIPFSSVWPRVNSVSVIEVLKGNVSADVLRDKIILVGATASGTGDRYPTPVASSAGAMPGVVVHAHLLNGRLNNYSIKSMSTWLNVSVSAVTVLIVLGLFLTFRLRHTFLISLGVIFASLIFSLVLLSMGWWSAPGARLIGIALAYLFWSWRRLNAVVTYFGLELDRMAQELTTQPALPKPTFHGDELVRRALALEAMIAHVHGSRRFIAQSLDSLPLAVFVTDLKGQVLLSNLSATTLWASNTDDAQELINKDIFQILREIEGPWNSVSFANEKTWRNNEHNLQRLPGQVILTPSGRSFKIQLAPLDTEKSEPTGWLVGLLEFTVERLAEEQRESMLRFLSHDLRAPQSVILALLAMQETSPEPLPYNELRRHIEQQVKRTLGLTDGFMLLDEAKSKPQVFEEVFLGAIVMDAVDQAWPLAQHKSIRFEQTFVDDEACLIHGSRELLTRAIFNLLENAVKYSEPSTTVYLQLLLHDGEVFLTLRDEGQGISEEDLPRLFDAFCQFGKGNTKGEGYGLGMAFVSSVMQRHGARIECISQINAGTTFRLYFRAV